MSARAFSFLLFGLAAPTSALAEPFAQSLDLRGFVDFRAAAADGEDSFLEEGFGKTRFSGGDDRFGTDAFAHAMLIWRHDWTWNLQSVVTVQADTQLEPVVDVVEAYLDYRGAPRDGWRFSGRAGLFYPPVSLEHDGPGWTPTNTITPSAINSWIGEEVKVIGVEATGRREFGAQELALTASVFGYNDTAGTLLAFRGWAMHDVMPGIKNEIALPERSFFYQDSTRASYELDDQIGYYTQVRYRPLGNVDLTLTYYDNRGDRISDFHGQTNWQTRFLDFGARIAIDEDTRLLAQAMSGRTVWGYLTPMGYWSDVDFNAAYILLARDFDAHMLSGRLDYFDIVDNSFVVVDNNDEEGWAATLAYQMQLSEHMRLAIEALHISSDRQPALIREYLLINTKLSCKPRSGWTSESGSL